MCSAELQQRANAIGVATQLAAASSPATYRNPATHAALGTPATASLISERLVARANDAVVVDNVLPAALLVQARTELTERAVGRGMEVS